ncbi:MAG TPA: DUF86 domain-containing protein [Thermoanaerobaculia bacterium]|nr:DUF86 domain-containing protein [Thermoanaerobaculia bacterium]
MQPEERDAAYLWDMLQASRDILEFTQGVSRDEYSSNKMLRMAVERGFQILGEAARRVTESFKATHPEIPWSPIVGHRNVIVHDYADLSPKRIWEVVEEDLPRLVQDLERLISPDMV